MSQIVETEEQESREKVCHVAAGKWAAVIDDVIVPVPRRKVAVSLMKELAGIPAQFLLVRDHNSPNDVVLDDRSELDLGLGNVFYRLERCGIQDRSECREAAKYAWILDDVAEITIRRTLTGKLLRELFNQPHNSNVVRDTESSKDDKIGLDDEVRFEDGPVFVSRHVHTKLTITVNSRIYTEHDGVKSSMTGLEIAALAYPENPSQTRVFLVSEGKVEIALDQVIKITGCESFDVVRKEVTGGYELSRVQREITELDAGGQRMTLLVDPVNCIVYHDLHIGSGFGLDVTDVLVPIPGGYPGQMIDGAYLPEDSPLIGRVKGKPQDHRISALDRYWRQISYHPHNGGGALSWNPTVHGFHTYKGELLSWLYDVK